MTSPHNKELVTNFIINHFDELYNIISVIQEYKESGYDKIPIDEFSILLHNIAKQTNISTEEVWIILEEIQLLSAIKLEVESAKKNKC